MPRHIYEARAGPAVKLLVVGASGLVGRKVAEQALEAGADVHGTYNSRGGDFGFPCTKLDVTDSEKVRGLVSDISPDAVINASALHDVDYCQDHISESDAVNSAAVGVLARACPGKLVHVSTDYVFDGAKGSPYSEADGPAPLSAYGRSKLAGERLLGPGDAVVRTSVVYGWAPAENAGERSSSRKGANFALWLLKSLSAGKQVSIVTDQYATATLADSLAGALLELAKGPEGGAFHFAGPDCQSRHEFAVQLAGTFGYDPGLVLPTDSSRFPQKAPRPASSCLDSSKARRLLGVSHPGTREALGIMKTQVEREAPGLAGDR